MTLTVIVKNNTLMTPEPRNILRGISREYVFELARNLGIKYKECNLDVYDVVNADEAFMTGTPFCILPVTSLDGQKIGDGVPGDMFKRLILEWGNSVNLDIIKQIKEWNLKDDKSSITVSPYSFGGKK